MSPQSAIYAVATPALLLTITLSVLELILSTYLDESDHFAAIRALLFATFALNITSLACLSYYTIIATPRLRSKAQRIAWFDTGLGAGYNAVVMLVNAIPPIWLLVLQHNVQPAQMALQISTLILWGLTSISQAIFFTILSKAVRSTLETALQPVSVAKFGITLPPSKDLAYGTRPSFCSRDTLFVSQPQSPTSSRTYSMLSSTTKAAASLRSKLARNSGRSSLDLPVFPAGEATAVGNAFDRYDSSQVDPETRNAILSGGSPSHLRVTQVLEPIPGSRPTSRGQDGHMRARSPSTVHDARNTALSKPKPNPFDTRSSSAASTAVPTSSSSSGASSDQTRSQSRTPASMNELIHPLFRPDSPAPPQIMTSNTMVTASPLANQPITPKSLERLRSSSDLRGRSHVAEPGSLMLSPKGQWRVMPPIEQSQPRPRTRSRSVTSCIRPGTAGSTGDDQMKLTRSDTMGSPGPSIVEEEDLPPILPGFVLSAGTRSSLVGYGKRKSVKRDSTQLG